MEAMHDWLAVWAGGFWPAMAAHLWPATLFAFVVWGASLLLGRAPAQWRYVVWFLALAKFLIPSAILLFLLGEIGLDLQRRAAEALPEGSIGVIVRIYEPFAAAGGGSEGGEPGIAVQSGHREFYCVLTVIWLAGCSILFGRWRRDRWRFARALFGGGMEIGGREFETLERVRRWMGMRRKVELIISRRIGEPGVWGLLRPVVALPEGMSERLDEQEMEAVLMHELMHIRREDNLIGSLQMLACCIFWFHPLIWLIDRRLLEERELACDEAVLRMGGEPQRYAAGLWKVMQFGMGWPVAGVSRAAGSNLRRRVENMLRADRMNPSTRYRLMAGAVVALLGALAVAPSVFNRQAVSAQNVVERNASMTGGVAGGVRDGVNGGVEGGVSGGVGGGVIGSRRTEYYHSVQAPPPPPPPPPPPQVLPDKWRKIAEAPSYPMQIKEALGTPVTITDARVRIMIDEENQARRSEQESAEIDLIAAQFDITLVNQTDRKIKAVIAEYSNPGIRGLVVFADISRIEIEPFATQQFDRGALHHFIALKSVPDVAYRFTFKISGVLFESGPPWIAPDLDAARIEGFKRSLNRIQERLKMQAESGDALEMREVSSRPVITYKEQAAYTEQARQNGTAGLVVLSVVFGSDGRIGEIKVVRGLPDGLTEQAIEAARKIRFKPATKDGQAVSVRANLEFSFSL